MSDSDWSPWIDWPGGECPIPWAKAGEWSYRTLDGTEPTWKGNAAAGRADFNYFVRRGTGLDIRAYRYLLSAAPAGFVPPSQGMTPEAVRGVLRGEKTEEPALTRENAKFALIQHNGAKTLCNDFDGKIRRIVRLHPNGGAEIKDGWVIAPLFWTPHPGPASAQKAEEPAKEEARSEDLPPPDTSPIAAAIETLKAAMQCPEYAWMWHCNLIPNVETGLDHEKEHRCAAALMRHLFDVDVTTFDMWKHLERVWADEKKPKPPAGLLRLTPMDGRAGSWRADA